MLITLSILTTIWNLFLFLLVLGLVICIHELGHLYFAKKAGILCHEFSFGMGPKLWSKKKGETAYSIRAIPFGGFVSMSGEELEEELVKIGDKVRLVFDNNQIVTKIILNESNPKFQDSLLVTIESVDLKNDKNLYINQYSVKQDAFYIFDKKEIQIAPLNRRFSDKTKWQRFITTFGGPLMNFVLAFFVFLIIAFIVGVPNTSSSVIGEVEKGTPAYEILQANDRVISINGINIDSWSGDMNSISSELGTLTDGYEFVVERNGEILTLETIHPLYVYYNLGVVADSSNQDLIIKTPAYTVTELLPGDKILAFNNQEMNAWEDVLDFAYANIEGSADKEDLYTITVFRQTTSEHSGTVSSILHDGGYYTVELDVENMESPIIYKFSDEEGLSVALNDVIKKGDALGTGNVYDFEFLVYGVKELKAMGVEEIFDSKIGISAQNKFSFFGSFGNALVLLWGAATSIFGTLGLLFTSNLVGVSDLGGFVAIFSMTSSAAAAGFVSLLSFIGLLSVNLGIVNLLPIPALDGGRLVFIGYEAITKRKPNKTLENWLHTIVFFLLMGLMLYVTYNDILRLFGI